MKNNTTIVFMGTPDFAVPCLNALVAAGYNVSLVVTQPDRPQGRGQKLLAPPVKAKAVELGIKVIQPENMQGDDTYQTLSNLKPDYFVVVAFGHILRQNVLDIPQKGAINVHGSILPKYRGSAPIQHAVLNGDKETGVTTMFMDKGMDTGDILEIATVPITEIDTAEDIYTKLAPLGANLLVSTLHKLGTGTLTPQKQNNSLATYAPMLKKEDGRINWNDPAQKIACQIRGLYAWPGAFAFIENLRVKFCNAVVANINIQLAPGEIKLLNKELFAGTGNGILKILAVQPAGGKELECTTFFMGYHNKFKHSQLKFTSHEA